jgi:dihydroorotate dehydrogenase
VYSLLKPVLFRIDPESAHDLTIQSLKRLGQCLGPSAPLDGGHCEIAGLKFKNSIGLAAGLDKNGVAISGFSRLGFGHIEVGTVTPRPQSGSPKPRVFRLTEDTGLINRFGFNNLGIDALVKELSDHPYQGVIGVNIGKNKDTPNESAHTDYVTCIQKAALVCDYITINISSPNTPGLRDLADAGQILNIVAPVLDARADLKNRKGSYLPVFVKLAPDFEDSDLVQVLEALKRTQADGIILTNTTLDRAGLASRYRDEVGGLSGAPLSSKSEHCLKLALGILENALPVISVGGVMSGDDAKRRIELGAKLVQIYTGLIYRGPALVKDAIRITRCP